jgi:hypothetical protein
MSKSTKGRRRLLLRIAPVAGAALVALPGCSASSGDLGDVVGAEAGGESDGAVGRHNSDAGPVGVAPFEGGAQLDGPVGVGSVDGGAQLDGPVGLAPPDGGAQLDGPLGTKTVDGGPQSDGPVGLGTADGGDQ